MNKVAILATGSMAQSKMVKDCDFVFKELEYYINFKDVEYRNGELSQDEFFSIIKDKKEIPKTSQPSHHMIKEIYESKLKDFEKIIVVAPSKVLSGTYQGCVAVANEINEQAGEVRVYVMETSSIALSECYVIEEIITHINNGADVEQTVAFAENLKGKTYAFATDAEFLKLSGRVSGTKALLISLLNVRPVILMKAFETPIIADKGRGFKFIKRYIKEQIITNNKNIKIYFSQMLMNHEEKEEIVSLIEKSGIDYTIVDDADIVVCTHFGPNSFGLLVVDK